MPFQEHTPLHASALSRVHLFTGFKPGTCLGATAVAGCRAAPGEISALAGLCHDFSSFLCPLPAPALQLELLL